MESCFATRMSTTPSSFIREILQVTEDPRIISFAGGLPNPETFPIAEMHEAVQRVLGTFGSKALQYSTTEGYRPLREFIAHRYHARFGLPIDPEQILITSGSQQAQDLVGKVFINAGDRVVLERPAYLGAIQAFSLYEPAFIAVPLEEDGIDIERLAAVLAERPAKLMYIVPNFQNPSGISYSLAKREALARQLRETGTVLIEDDPYGELRFQGNSLSPVAAWLPERTVLLGSFSKVFSPGMRLGWVCAPKTMMRHFVVARQASDLHTSVFSQYVLAQYLQDNDLEAHIAAIRLRYKRQRDIMVQAVARYCPPEVTCTRPDGGMFLWMTLPEGLTAMALFEIAIQERVAFVPGLPFYVDGTGHRCMRLNFSNASPEQIEIGMQCLGRAIQRMMAVA